MGDKNAAKRTSKGASDSVEKPANTAEQGQETDANHGGVASESSNARNATGIHPEDGAGEQGATAAQEDDDAIAGDQAGDSENAGSGTSEGAGASGNVQQAAPLVAPPKKGPTDGGGTSDEFKGLPPDVSDIQRRFANRLGPDGYADRWVTIFTLENGKVVERLDEELSPGALEFVKAVTQADDDAGAGDQAGDSEIVGSGTSEGAGASDEFEGMPRVFKAVQRRLANRRGADGYAERWVNIFTLADGAVVERLDDELGPRALNYVKERATGDGG